VRAIATCLRIQGRSRGAGRRQLPEIPRNVPETGTKGCLRGVEASLPEQGPVGRTRRRKLPQVSPDLPLIVGIRKECPDCSAMDGRNAGPIPDRKAPRPETSRSWLSTSCSVTARPGHPAPLCAARCTLTCCDVFARSADKDKLAVGLISAKIQPH